MPSWMQWSINWSICSRVALSIGMQSPCDRVSSSPEERDMKVKLSFDVEELTALVEESARRSGFVLLGEVKWEEGVATCDARPRTAEETARLEEARTWDTAELVMTSMEPLLERMLTSAALAIVGRTEELLGENQASHAEAVWAAPVPAGTGTTPATARTETTSASALAVPRPKRLPPPYFQTKEERKTPRELVDAAMAENEHYHNPSELSSNTEIQVHTGFPAEYATPS